jgi:protein TonB
VRPQARLAFVAIVVAAGADALLMLTLAWLSRAAPAPTQPPLPPLARLSIAEPTVEAEQPLAPARAVAAEETLAAPPPPALDLPPLGEGPPLPRLEAPMLAPALPVISATMPAFVSDSAGLAGPSAPSELPPVAALGPGDSPPELLTPINLERFYPRGALRRGVAGDTRLKLSIGEDGLVRACEVVESSPAGVFDEAARRLGLSLRFRPERRGGQAVPSVIIHPIHWQPP